MKKLAAKKKPLSHMKNTSKGPIHHVEIHPAKNSAGGLAFLTKSFREPSDAEKAAADKSGRYLPDYKQDGPDVAHEDGEDMLDHVGKTYGVQHGADDDEDEDDEAAE